MRIFLVLFTTQRDVTARTTTTIQPDLSTTILTDFADGQSKSISGTGTSPRFYSYATHNEQGGGRLNASAPTASGPWTRSYSNLDGNAFKTTFFDGNAESVLQSTSFDALVRASGFSIHAVGNATPEHQTAISCHQTITKLPTR